MEVRTHLGCSLNFLAPHDGSETILARMLTHTIGRCLVISCLASIAVGCRSTPGPLGPVDGSSQKDSSSAISSDSGAAAVNQVQQSLVSGHRFWGRTPGNPGQFGDGFGDQLPSEFEFRFGGSTVDVDISFPSGIYLIRTPNAGLRLDNRLWNHQSRWDGEVVYSPGERIPFTRGTPYKVHGSTVVIDWTMGRTEYADCLGEGLGLYRVADDGYALREIETDGKIVLMRKD